MMVNAVFEYDLLVPAKLIEPANMLRLTKVHPIKDYEDQERRAALEDDAYRQLQEVRERDGAQHLPVLRVYDPDWTTEVIYRHALLTVGVLLRTPGPPFRVPNL